MTEKTSSPVMISIDLKKNRIRIYKSMLQLLGNPKYIQLLVNPNNKHIAIKGKNEAKPEDQAERIKPQNLMIDNSYDFYSKSFLKRLCKVDANFERNNTYQLKGKIVPSHNMAVFPLATMTRVEV